MDFTKPNALPIVLFLVAVALQLATAKWMPENQVLAGLLASLVLSLSRSAFALNPPANNNKEDQ